MQPPRAWPLEGRTSGLEASRARWLIDDGYPDDDGTPPPLSENAFGHAAMAPRLSLSRSAHSGTVALRAVRESAHCRISPTLRRAAIRTCADGRSGFGGAVPAHGNRVRAGRAPIRKCADRSADAGLAIRACQNACSAAGGHVPAHPDAISCGDYGVWGPAPPPFGDLERLAAR
ncbi:MAG: hypothetical protein IPM54_16115 [Polyangiaceae bacterium]|nr:hypothetical protein [Polyangiaceae bacterium]